MPHHGCGSVRVPIENVAVVEQCRQHLIQELDDVRLALRALDAEAPNEARSAFLHVIDGQLKRISEEVEMKLANLPQWLIPQT